jgi:hypothetical protein
MLFNGQLLVEVLVGILILAFLSLILFLIFNAVPKFIQSIEESIIVFNRSLNYQNILIGLSRKSFSQFESLLVDQPYFLSPTTTGYEIKIGKENFNNDYYQWFEINKDNLITVYIQSPFNVYSFPLLLSGLKDKIFIQDKWEVATDTVIDLTTNPNVNQYYQKSQGIQINDKIQLSTPE